MPPTRRFQPGLFLIHRGWWVLPALLSISLSLPWVFGERWYADTAYYQAIATKAAREGHWWTLMQGDLHYFNKPPLMFWIHGVLVCAFGNVDWSVHLPEMAGYVLTCVLVGWLGKRLHGPLTGALAGSAMALTNDWVARVPNFKLDISHTLLLLAACACWVKAFAPPTRDDIADDAKPSSTAAGYWCLLAGVCIGAALMVKPLIGLGLPLLGLAWIGLAGLWRRERPVLVLSSAAIGLLVALPWHASMLWMYGKTFSHTYVVEQSVMRATGERFEAKSWWWYFSHAAGETGDAVNPIVMWPIYALAVSGIVVMVARRKRATAAAKAGDALAVLWTVVWFAALSMFAGKRNYYLMVVHPGTAWLAGIAVASMIELAAKRFVAVLAFVRGVAAAMVLACLVLLGRAPHTIHKAERELPVPERDQFMAFLRTRGEHAVYNCGLPYRMASMAYIQAGVWPRSIQEREPMPWADVPSGAWMVYRDDLLARPEWRTNLKDTDRVVFRSTPNGNYIVTEKTPVK